MSAADIFVDTNVLLYILSDEAAKADRAEALAADGATISIQVLNEFANAASRKMAVSMSEVRHILSRLRATCTVVPLDIATHERGLGLAERHRFSVYDSMTIAAALQAGCRTLYSEDFIHGQLIDGLTIRNPFRSAS
ncbi:MAG TPA: PIN domain-containing protein [Afifellaceae bacterium]|nr:PIN domain-containing protein [Afifellaceae bacterium]